jgi:UDP-N-acetylenolpyruvoylglucosamine reductase
LQVQAEVERMHGVRLETEVRIVGDAAADAGSQTYE